MADARAALASRVASELAEPVSEGAVQLAHSVRDRFGPATRAVVFYGSCLRRQTTEGIHDFYAVVDDYRSAYASRGLAWANAALAPNVFYHEKTSADGVLRAKVAVVSGRDLARGTLPRAWRSALWARFAQPVRAVWVRDAEARGGLVDACVASLRTAVRFGLAGAPPGVWTPVDSAAFWPSLFRETYAAELRPEREAAIAALYTESPARFDAALEETLRVLADSGVLDLTAEGGRLQVRLREPWPGPPRRLARIGSKALTAAQLVKSAFTFGDWLPYVLWKIERHSGTRLEPSERQRRHPLLFAWPLLLQALHRRALR